MTVAEQLLFECSYGEWSPIDDRLCQSAQGTLFFRNLLNASSSSSSEGESNCNATFGVLSCAVDDSSTTAGITAVLVIMCAIFDTFVPLFFSQS